MNNNNPNFDREAFKRAIAQVESSGGKNLDNSNSSAAGRYHFLYRYIKDSPVLKGIGKREFMSRPDLQEKIMDMALDGKLKGFPAYERNSYDLKESHNTNLRADEIAALTHFLGASGVRRYLKDPDNYEVSGKTNASVRQYVGRFNEAQGTIPSYESNPYRTSKSTVQNNGLFSKEALGNPLPSGEYPVGEPDVVENKLFSFPAQQEESAQFETPETHPNGKQNLDAYQYGGNMNPGTEGEDLIEFEGGGTHEENSLGGIPQGVGSNGKLNTVEEGESKFTFDDGDYVFSDRGMLDGTGFEDLGNNKMAYGGPVDPPVKRRDATSVRNNRVINPNAELRFKTNEQRAVEESNKAVDELALDESEAQAHNTSQEEMLDRIISERINQPEEAMPIARTLRRGARGGDVEALQLKLISKGFLAEGEVDGVFGRKTKEAVRRYQESKGITSDGIVGKETYGKLNEVKENYVPQNITASDNTNIARDTFKTKDTSVNENDGEAMSDEVKVNNRFGVEREVSKTGLKKIKSSTIRDAFNNLIPTSGRTLVNDLTGHGISAIKNYAKYTTTGVMGNESPGKDFYNTITEENFPQDQLDALSNVVSNVLKKGNNTFAYDDWRKYGGMSGGSSIENGLHLDNPANVIGQTLGKASIYVDDDGNIFVEDRYNFNDAAMPGEDTVNLSDLQDKRNMIPWTKNEKGVTQTLGGATYAIGRNIGGSFGSNNNEGAKVSIYVGNINEEKFKP